MGIFTKKVDSCIILSFFQQVFSLRPNKKAKIPVYVGLSKNNLNQIFI